MKCFIAAPGMNPLAKAQLRSSSVLMIPPSSLETAQQPLPSLATGEAEQLLGALNLQIYIKILVSHTLGLWQAPCKVRDISAPLKHQRSVRAQSSTSCEDKSPTVAKLPPPLPLSSYKCSGSNQLPDLQGNDFFHRSVGRFPYWNKFGCLWHTGDQTSLPYSAKHCRHGGCGRSYASPLTPTSPGLHSLIPRLSSEYLHELSAK